jgi:hypothetical protein
MAFQYIIEKLEYVKENIYVIETENDNIIIIHVIKDLFKNAKEEWVIQTLNQIIFGYFEEKYWIEYKRYKHWENAEELRKKNLKIF